MKTHRELTGDAWLTSKRRRRLELFVIAGFSPLLGAVALPATLGVRHAQGGGPIVHEVPRSLYPGHEFNAKKFGDPENKSRLLTICRKAMLDELPQLADIIRRNGPHENMSLWGPRADTPEHTADLFAAVYEADYELGCWWEEARSMQNPGVLSTYAIHSHANNLEALTEAERFSADEKLHINALLRAQADVYDRRVASPGHDIRLLNQAYGMAVANYQQYTQRLIASRQ